MSKKLKLFNLGRVFEKEIVLSSLLVIASTCRLNVGVQDDHFGTISIKLYNHIVPTTTANFVSFCNAEENGYKGTTFHRVLPNVMIQGGKIRGFHNDQ